MDMHSHGLSSELIKWFLQGPFSHLVAENRHSHLQSLNAILDNSLGLFRKSQRMGIEIHHDNSGKADFGIFGDSSITCVDGISYSSGIKQWLDQVKAKNLGNAFPSKYFLEFDDNDNDYQLMGLFQSCDPYYICTDTILELMSINCNEEGFLSSTLKLNGIPEWIGLIDRWREHVKLVIPLSGEFSKPLQEFMTRWFMTQLSSAGLSAEEVARNLKAWAKNGVVRLSVDCMLKQDEPGQRLCFEIFEGQNEVNIMRNPEPLLKMLKRLNIPVDQILRFQELRSRLPYGTYRPSVNLVNSDVLLLAASHAKICFNNCGASLKDYLLLSGIQGNLEDVVIPLQ